MVYTNITTYRFMFIFFNKYKTHTNSLKRCSHNLLRNSFVVTP
jgi:hypothetical protein